MNKKFLNCGMSRRTYLLENNTVLKVPIKGRE